MIIFEKIRWRNFLATGSNWIEVDLNADPSTLIVGSNGSGKSTLITALSFGLFGRGDRNIKNEQLVNTINRKNLLVEVEFKIGSNHYLVRRGFKPRRMEIEINGVLDEQFSHAKETQAFLEQTILKFNYKSFRHIVVLGSATFVPFMQLHSNARREIIEEILDIQVFSAMNQIAKEKVSALKQRCSEADSDIKSIAQLIVAQIDHLRDLQSINLFDQKEKETKTRLKALHDSIADFETTDDPDKLKDLYYRLKERIRSIEEHSVVIEANNNCPTCLQTIDQATVDRVVEFNNQQRNQVYEQINGLEGRLDQARKYKQIQKEISDLTTELQRYSVRDPADPLNSQISNLQNKITDLRERYDKTEHDRVEHQSDYRYYRYVVDLLKDEGIRTEIIEQYLPTINYWINYYLQLLDFFVSFNLDAGFNESIRSRHLDNFSYQNFSEGEKQRIDLALLFTWREVARMKNTVNTNLLILDETFDASLDENGVENLLKILRYLSKDKDLRLFVISHKEELLEPKFDQKIRFAKQQNFSTVSKIEPGKDAHDVLNI